MMIIVNWRVKCIHMTQSLSSRSFIKEAMRWRRKEKKPRKRKQEDEEGFNEPWSKLCVSVSIQRGKTPWIMKADVIESKEIERERLDPALSVFSSDKMVFAKKREREKIEEVKAGCVWVLNYGPVEEEGLIRRGRKEGERKSKQASHNKNKCWDISSKNKGKTEGRRIKHHHLHH